MRHVHQRIMPTISPIANAVDSYEVLRGIFDSPAQVAGVTVNEKTSMRVSAVYACVRLIAGAIASLPCHIYERTEDDRARVDHAYWWLLNEQPVDAYSAPTFWEWVVAQVLLRGDGLCYLARNRAGVITAIVPLDKARVRIERVATERAGHRLKYYIQTDEGTFGADQDDILHFPGFGFDGCTSMSVIEWGARTASGIAIAADEFAGTFFAKGAQPQHVIKAAGHMDQKQQDGLRAAWEQKYSGKGPNGIPLVLTEGLDISQLTMTAKDAQLLESRQWQTIDIARAFGVPPFMIGETDKTTSWGTGVESMGIGFVTYTIGPHLRRLQTELNRKLFRTPKYFAEFLTVALMKGDHAARANYYKAALGGTQNPAWMVQNEVRKAENLPRIEDPKADELSRPEPKTNATEPAAATAD